jgi:hypothetical protein
MLKIQFRETNACPQVQITQGGYQRSFVREEQPFPLHDNPALAEFEQRFFATHEYLEVVEVADPVTELPTQTTSDNSTTTAATDSQIEQSTGEGSVIETTDAAPVTDELVTPAQPAANPAPTGKTKKKD